MTAQMGGRVIADQRERLEHLLGTSLPTGTVRVHTYRAPGESTYEVDYAAIDIAPEEAAAVRAGAGLDTPEAVTLGTMLLPGGWSVEPGDPPPWWPADPAGLADQAAIGLEPGGWLACGYQDGTLFVLATTSGER